MANEEEKKTNHGEARIHELHHTLVLSKIAFIENRAQLHKNAHINQLKR